MTVSKENINSVLAMYWVSTVHKVIKHAYTLLAVSNFEIVKRYYTPCAIHSHLKSDKYSVQFIFSQRNFWQFHVAIFFGQIRQKFFYSFGKNCGLLVIQSCTGKNAAYR